MQPETVVLRKKTSDYRAGIQEGISIAIGYIPIALTFGLLAKTTGLSLAETLEMSAFVFAGASQFVALNLVTLGTGGLEIILTTFIINIRHLLLTASINEKSRADSRWIKALYAFGVTDETFSVAATSGRTVTAPYMFGLITMAYSSWVVCSGLGFYIGAAFPDQIKQSMGIALYAMFVGLLVPSLKKHRKVLVLAVTAALLHGIFYFFMNTGWAIVSATLLSAVGVEFLWRGREVE